MAQATHKIVVKAGEYTDRLGNSKTRWLRIGTVFKLDRGTSIKLECIPVGVPDWQGWANVYPLDDDRSTPQGRTQAAQQTAPAPNGSDFSDDIPF